MYRLIAFVNVALIKVMLKLKRLKQSDEGDGFHYTIIYSSSYVFVGEHWQGINSPLE